MRFTKMHGAGNDYVYVDCFAEKMPSDPAALAQKVADRHYGVGGDGLILICPSDRGDARMRMFNADGSASELSGNGLRCLAALIARIQKVPRGETIAVETGAGTKHLVLLDQQGSRYLADIQALDGWVRAQIAALPPAQRRAVTTHDAFGYFAAEYDRSVNEPLARSTSATSSRMSATLSS